MHEAMISFFQAQMDYIFFFYGLSFILIGGVCLFMMNSAKYRFEWVFFGLFGLIHGINEWLDLIAMVYRHNDWLNSIQLILLSVSFICLVEFGRRNTSLKKNGLLGPAIYLFAIVMMLTGWFLAGDIGINIMARYVLGLGGGLCSAVALYRFSASQKKPTAYLRRMALTMGLYAVAAGLIVPDAEFFPANLINQSSFLHIFGVPVQLVRGLFALALSFFTCGYAFECLFLSYPADQKARQQFYKNLMYGMIIIVAGVGWICAEKSSDDIKSRFKKELLTRVKTLAAVVDVSKIRGLSGVSGDAELLDYVRLKEGFIQVRRVNKDCRFLYLMKMKNGQPIFLLDAEDSASQDYSPPGQVYTEADSQLIAALASGKAYVSGPQKDRWGEWVTGFAPVFDYNGRFLALLGMDVSVQAFRQYAAGARLTVILVTLLVILLVLTLFLVIVALEERALRVKGSEERLSFALEGSRSGAWEADLGTGVLTVDDRFLEIVQESKGVNEFSLRIWEERTHPDDWPVVQEKFRRFFTGEIVFFEAEHRVCIKEGKWKWVLIRGKVIRYAFKGKPLVTAGIMMDITDRKIAEGLLQEREAQYQMRD